MLFNSLDFALFLPVVFLVYWLLLGRSRRAQNIFLLGASYVFYGWWDWRFVSLVVLSSFCDYLIGLGLARSEAPTRRRLLLLTSLLFNLGLLGFFKYFNFFLESFGGAFTLFGRDLSAERLSIILPVGISFYTFQTLSYTIDVYRRKIDATRDLVAFFAFVSFFPQLVAGPIERAGNLLPQFQKTRRFDYDNACDGLRQALWGLVKKMVIADNCAVLVNEIFGSYQDQGGLTLALGSVFFAFQIYGDFSGYSDIAIGVSRLFGFTLGRNFAFPYFSRDIAEFWRRWHISLTTWFKDYLYIPLGGSRGGLVSTLRNTLIIFLVSGFWHGANWTFVAWGLLNALYFFPQLIAKTNRRFTASAAPGRLLPRLGELRRMLITFGLVCLGWILFRAESIGQALGYMQRMFTTPHVDLAGGLAYVWRIEVLLLVLFVLAEWVQREREHALDLHWPRALRHAVYYALMLVILVFGKESQDFIYFQF